MSIKALPDHRQLLTISQAAKQLNVSVQTLRDWTDDDRIDAFVTDGNHRRYQQDDVHQLALQVKAQAQGRTPDMELCYIDVVVQRQGDTYSLLVFDDNQHEHVNVEGYDFSALPVELLTGKRTWATLNKEAGEASQGYQLHRKLERDFVYQGTAQWNISEPEMGGKFNDAYVQVWVKAVAADLQETQQCATEAVQQALYRLAALKAVTGIVSYQQGTQHIAKYVE